MIGNKFIADTNIIIDLFGGEKKIADYFENADAVYAPSIVIGELIVGALLSKKKTKHLR